MSYSIPIPQGNSVGLTRTTVNRTSLLEADRAGVSSVNPHQFSLPVLVKDVLVGPSGCILIVSDSSYNFYVDSAFVGQLSSALQFGSPSSFLVAPGIVPGWHKVKSEGNESYFMVFTL